MMKANEDIVLMKARFLGKRFNRPMWRFVWAILCFPLAGIISPALSRRTLEVIILDIIAFTLFFSIPIVMIPVVLWGRRWQRFFAWSIIALVGGGLLAGIIDALFDPF